MVQMDLHSKVNEGMGGKSNLLLSYISSDYNCVLNTLEKAQKQKQNVVCAKFSWQITEELVHCC